MFKKLLSVLTVMLCVFGMNVSAQELQKLDLGKQMPRFAGKNVVTSKIDMAGDEFWAGYWDGTVDEKLGQMGGIAGIPITYGCAIKYPAGSDVTNGNTITGVKFTFMDSKHIENVKIFVATELPNKAEESNVTWQEVKELTSLKNENDPFNEVRLDKPYKVDPTKPVYIGYFFDVVAAPTDAESFPIVVYGSDGIENTMLMCFDAGANAKSWVDYAPNKFGLLALQVLMKGAFEENAATVVPDLGTITGSKGTTELPIVIENAGSKGIESVAVEVDINGVKTEVEAKPETPIIGIGEKFAFNAKVNSPEATGSYDFTVKLTKINGKAPAKESVGKGQIFIISRLVQHTVFFEEFTGMWCGGCPQGIVAIEKIKNLYGDDKVVVVAAHDKDPLSCRDYSAIIKQIPGFPTAHVDRVYKGISPYFGTDGSNFGIKNDIDKFLAKVPVAEIKSKPSLDGDILTAGAEVHFLYSGDASDYALGYVLTEDGMKNDKWTQTNFLYDKVEWLERDPLFEPWVNAEKKVKGVVFGEVAIAAEGIESGIAGSIPAEVTEDVPVSHSVELNLKDYKKIQNRDNLNLVVVLFNTKTGVVENSAIMSVKDGASGIEEIEGEDINVVETARYTIDGRRINAPEKGINIVKYSDGKIKKVIVK